MANLQGLFQSFPSRRPRTRRSSFDGCQLSLATLMFKPPASASPHRLQERDGVLGNDRVVDRNRNLRLSRINEEGGDLERFA
jgi:hypothetical protein